MSLLPCSLPVLLVLPSSLAWKAAGVPGKKKAKVLLDFKAKATRVLFGEWDPVTNQLALPSLQPWVRSCCSWRALRGDAAQCGDAALKWCPALAAAGRGFGKETSSLSLPSPFEHRDLPGLG